MNDAMATGTPTAGRASRIGRLATRLVTSWLAVLLVLSATLEVVAAEKSPGSYQNAFTAACRNHGGTPKRVRTRVVKCTLTDGTVITCDFNFNPPECTKPLTQPSSPVTDPATPPTDGNEQPIIDDGKPVGGGAGGIDATWTADLGASGAQAVLTAYHGGAHDLATHHAKHKHRGHAGHRGSK